MTDLDLSVELVAANGAVKRLGSEENDPEDVPQGISFNTRLMHGFADAGMTLARRLDGDYVDLNLLDALNLIGGDGATAYEGRIVALPRSFDNQHSVSVQAAGWMSHAKDRKFTQIYVDRDLSAWGPARTARRVAQMNSGYGQVSDPAVSADQSGRPTVQTKFSGAWLSTGRPIGEAWYDAGPGNFINRLTANWTRGKLVSGSAPWEWYLALATNDTASASNSSTNLAAAGPGSASLTATTADRRFGLLQLHWATATAAGAAGEEYSIDWDSVAVYGDHGLTLQGATAPFGVLASDVIKHIVATYCPMLNTAGVQATTYTIPHLVFRERTNPYDAFLEVNKYHLWNLSCWDNRTLRYGPLDYTDYDWEIRTDTEGTIVGLQGDSIENLASGIVVRFQNVATGQADVLTPDGYGELRDDSVDNPFNAHGYKGWTEYEVRVPTTQDAALQIGRAALAEFNAPKAPGSITKSHYIRDRAGHLQPVWKVRAGDRVAITSSASLSDRPRMIQETSYNHDSRTLTMSVEGPPARLEAISDRVLTALQAANLS